MASTAPSGKPPVFSASAAIDALARDLSQIKRDDRLTYADIGAMLGKSEDMAAKYCDGTAVMDAVTLARGKREWNGRFTGTYDRLCEQSRQGKGTSDRSKATIITEALLKISVALEDDEEVSPGEVRAIRKQLEQGRDVFNELLARLPSPVRAA